VPLAPGILGRTFVVQCHASLAAQKWVMGPSGTIGQANGDLSYCIYAGGEPAPLLTCNASDPGQIWAWRGMFLVNPTSGQCIGIHGQAGTASIQGCEDPSNPDSRKQQWQYSGGLLRSLVRDLCPVSYFVPAVSACAYGTGESAVSFLVNRLSTNTTVSFQGIPFSLRSGSVQIVDSAASVLFDTSAVVTEGLSTERGFKPIAERLLWEQFIEAVEYPGALPSAAGPLPQLELTQDKTEYMVYENREVQFPAAAEWTLEWTGRKANAYLVFVDGQLAGSDQFNAVHGAGPMQYSVKLQTPALAAGVHRVSILSVSLGNFNVFQIERPAADQDDKGIQAGTLPVLSGVNSTPNWLHRPFLTGELLQVYTAAGGAKVAWTASGAPSPLSWYRSTFSGAGIVQETVVVVDMGADNLNRGHLYVNGVDLGRYWGVKSAPVGAGAAGMTQVQRYYFVPFDVIQDQNLLVFVDEMGGIDLTSIGVLQTLFTAPSAQSPTA
jgi:hypothetical protein